MDRMGNKDRMDNKDRMVTHTVVDTAVDTAVGFRLKADTALDHPRFLLGM